MSDLEKFHREKLRKNSFKRNEAFEKFFTNWFIGFGREMFSAMWNWTAQDYFTKIFILSAILFQTMIGYYQESWIKTLHSTHSILSQIAIHFHHQPIIVQNCLKLFLNFVLSKLSYFSFLRVDSYQNFQKNRTKTCFLGIAKHLSVEKDIFDCVKDGNRNFCQARIKVYDLGYLLLGCISSSKYAS